MATPEDYKQATADTPTNEKTIEVTVKDYFDKKIDRNTAITVLVLAGLSGAEARELANS